jgi:hypothetical protein
MANEAIALQLPGPLIRALRALTPLLEAMNETDAGVDVEIYPAPGRQHKAGQVQCSDGQDADSAEDPQEWNWWECISEEDRRRLTEPIDLSDPCPYCRSRKSHSPLCPVRDWEKAEAEEDREPAVPEDGEFDTWE